MIRLQLAQPSCATFGYPAFHESLQHLPALLLRRSCVIKIQAVHSLCSYAV